MDCYYHPKNPLQNFCNNPSCALPLCPKCINIHLSQSNCTHELIALNEALAMSSEQLQTSYTGLAHELKSLKQDYQPHTVLKDYTNVLAKFRQEALDEINRHYDYLERELLSQISSRFSQHLQSLVIPIEEQLAAVDRARNNIKKHDKQIETLILVVSQQRVSAVEQILKKSKERKALFKNQLPRLQDAEGGRLKMTSQRAQLISDRYSRVISPAAVNPSLPVLAGLDRIAQLQARLQALRYGQ